MSTQNIHLNEDEVLETSVIAGKRILKKVQRTRKKETDFVKEVESVDNISYSDLFAEPYELDDFSALYGKLPESTDDIDFILQRATDSSEIKEESEDYFEEFEESKEDAVDSSVDENGNKVRKRINTLGIFDNTDFFNGGSYAEEHISRKSISINPLVEEQYDYSVAEDIVLLQDRKETTEIIYDIFQKAPFAPFYTDNETGIIKIPKNDIQRVFYYVKDRLLKRKKLSAFETVIAINEFFEFNYEYIVKKVLSSNMMSEILDDYYQNLGMKDRIEDESLNPLF